ncbi:MAG: GTPase [Ilumatobacter coccineus]|uniref:GTPase n=1 Tax=Ilumatobacter coccineus TaxID=467094 RepID=A0A2G6K9L9_9ACTN|nr:MAG: GTPase [Ilumatobacter coccineus]
MMGSLSSPRRVVIIGAAGRDFHNFNTVFRGDANYRVVAFTAAQIPNIDNRVYPASLAGDLYPDGIPIVEEAQLEDLIKREQVDVAVFSYSDVTYDHVMRVGARINAAGADMWLLSANHTMVTSTRPLIAICATRTGVGKSQTSRYVASILKEMGKTMVSIRHPMPYGDLAAQACQRFASYDDLDRHRCTIEEREEYEPHIDNGLVIYAGVDYEQIVRQAEQEADVIVWDGGNNDLPFYAPDLMITLVDPLRSGDEMHYHPSEVNVLLADVVIVNKCDSATPSQIDEVIESVKATNPTAEIVLANSPVTVDDPSLVAGKKVVVVEDGPTVTHGSMSFGAGVVGARAAGAAEIIDPSPMAVGSLATTYATYPHARGVLPAMGYGDAQIREVEATIEATDCDAVVTGTPIDITRVMSISKPLTRARYELEEHTPGQLAAVIKAKLSSQL